MGGRAQSIRKQLARTESDDDMSAIPSSEDNRVSEDNRGTTSDEEQQTRKTSKPSKRRNDDQDSDSDGGSSASEHEEDRRRRQQGKKTRPLTQKRLNKMRWSKQVRKLQRAEACCMSKLSFARACKEIFQKHLGRDKVRVQALAIGLLHVASEDYLTRVMSDSNLCAIHAGRVTVQARDMYLARRLRGDVSSVDDGITDFAPQSHPMKKLVLAGKAKTRKADKKWASRPVGVDVTDRFQIIAEDREEEYKQWCEDNGHHYVRELRYRQSRPKGRKSANPRKVVVTPIEDTITE